MVKRFFLFIVTTIVLASCDSFLDTTPDDLRRPEQMFATQSSTENVLLGVYSFIRSDIPWDNVSSGVGGSSSDLDYVWANRHTYNLGVWDASAAQYDKWVMYYKAIREVTYFLQNLDKCPPSELPADLREQWRAEARCLRAYFYANLMRMYGPVILLKDELVDFTQEDMSRPRSTWDECVEWVCNEFLEVSKNEYLPTLQTAQNYARMCKGIALAYRARLYLQSASEQFNGNPMYANVCNLDGTHLFPLKKDPSKWTKAREAAKDVIKLGVYHLVKVMEDGKIEPYKSYKSVFTTLQNEEMIMPFLEINAHMDKHATPNLIGGWGGFGPTQEMVDMYAMDNGRYPIRGYKGANRLQPAIDPLSGYNEGGFTTFTHPLEKTERRTFNMYVNREPRFYVSVLYGGLSWFVTNRASDRKVIEMFANGNNGSSSTHNYYTTGYAMIKFVSPDYVANPVHNVKREMPYLRYAEILLNYIEATIGSGDLEDSDMYTYWNELRERAGLKGILEVYPEAKGDSQQLLELLRRERRVELAFECQTFFDTRRWMIAEKETEAGDFHGMNISVQGRNNSGVFPDSYFERTLLETRVFNPSFYLYPIPQTAINRNHSLVQNYNW